MAPDPCICTLSATHHNKISVNDQAMTERIMESAFEHPQQMNEEYAANPPPQINFKAALELLDINGPHDVTNGLAIKFCDEAGLGLDHKVRI